MLVKKIGGRSVILTCVISLLWLTSCSQEPKVLSLDAAQAYLVTTPSPLLKNEATSSSLTPVEEQLFLNYAPGFVIEDNHLIYNKIGEAHLRRLETKKIQAYIDPTQPKIYVQKIPFTTAKGSYTNLVYRIHFQKVPFSLMPFNITAGNSGGLLIFVTLNDKNEPILLTTVHTCGCYTSVIPTNFLSKDAFPADWKEEAVYRYGEKHPGLLHYPEPFSSQYHPIYYMRSQTHRVADVFIEKISGVKDRYSDNPMPLASMNNLDHLKIDEETELGSFYYDGLNKGFVRSVYKPFEFLFMSLIAMDMNIGVDKKYAPHTELRSRFYTSLNPLNRKKSDAWDFAKFLQFWGWEL